MNNRKQTEQQTKQETTSSTTPAIAGKLSLSTLGSELLLDLVVALTIGWGVFRLTENSNWAWLAGVILMAASFVRQGLKQFIHLVKPIYQNCSPWVKIFCKTIPVGVLVLISLLKLCGPVLGLFGATVFTVTLTTVFWLNRADVPRF